MIVFKTDRIKEEWGELLDERLKFVLRSLNDFMEEETGCSIRITSLAYYPKTEEVEGRKKNTKHLVNHITKRCEAADINPDHTLQRSLWESWRKTAAIYLAQVVGVDTVLHGNDDSRHLHVEVDVEKTVLRSVSLDMPTSLMKIR